MTFFSREYAVKQMLTRHVSLRDTTELNKERFLIESVHIPAEWIHEAKVCLAYFLLIVYRSFLFLSSVDDSSLVAS